MYRLEFRFQGLKYRVSECRNRAMLIIFAKCKLTSERKARVDMAYTKAGSDFESWLEVRVWISCLCAEALLVALLGSELCLGLCFFVTFHVPGRW